MVKMSSYSCVVRISVLFTVLALSCGQEDNYCHQDKVKECLQPSYDYLKTNNNNGKSFLYVSLKHYFGLLDGSDPENVIHVHALDTITQPLDEIIIDRSRHDELCSKLDDAKQCLKRYETQCDSEVRYELEGIKKVFTDVCKNSTKKVFNKLEPCVLDEEVTSFAPQCESLLNKTIKQVTPALSCLDSSNVTEECEAQASAYPETLITKGLAIPIDDDGAHAITRSKICTGVERTLMCYKDHVSEQCGPEAGQWEYTVRHHLVQFLLMDLGCESEGSYVYNSSCFACDTNVCLDRSKVCDGNPDCEDGSDELKKYCEEKSMSVLSILIIVAVVLVVVGIVIACVAKCATEKKFNQSLNSHSNSEEMMNIVTEEMSVGRSTPPPNSYKSNENKNANYIYKPIQT